MMITWWFKHSPDGWIAFQLITNQNHQVVDGSGHGWQIVVECSTITVAYCARVNQQLRIANVPILIMIIVINRLLSGTKWSLNDRLGIFLPGCWGVNCQSTNFDQHVPLIPHPAADVPSTHSTTCGAPAGQNPIRISMSSLLNSGAFISALFSSGAFMPSLSYSATFWNISGEKGEVSWVPSLGRAGHRTCAKWRVGWPLTSYALRWKIQPSRDPWAGSNVSQSRWRCASSSIPWWLFPISLLNSCCWENSQSIALTTSLFNRYLVVNKSENHQSPYIP